MTSACPKCGFSPDAQVTARWSFALDMQIKSMNRHAVNFGAARFAYRKERDAWQWLIKRARMGMSMAKARACSTRRVTIMRHFTGRCRPFDQDNLVGAVKIVVDALKREGVIHDDAPAWLELHVLQLRGERNETTVEVEELA